MKIDHQSNNPSYPEWPSAISHITLNSPPPPHSRNKHIVAKHPKYRHRVRSIGLPSSKTYDANLFQRFTIRYLMCNTLSRRTRDKRTNTTHLPVSALSQMPMQRPQAHLSHFAQTKLQKDSNCTCRITDYHRKHREQRRNNLIISYN